MTKIFIEAKSNKTSEYHFLQAIISKFFPAIEVEFIFMDGIGNLYNETNLNQIKLAQETDEQVIVFADADTVAKGYGYVKRKKEIDNGIATNNDQCAAQSCTGKRLIDCNCSALRRITSSLRDLRLEALQTPAALNSKFQ